MCWVRSCLESKLFLKFSGDKSCAEPVSCGPAVHNVGTNIRKPTASYTDSDYHTVMSTNLESTYKLTQASCLVQRHML